MIYLDKSEAHGTGRRKHAVAQVRLYNNGSGSFIVNKKKINDYFGLESLGTYALFPLEVASMQDKFDIVCTVHGGGLCGQSGAIRHGLARALASLEDQELRPKLKKAGLLTRDPRMKERKKYGLKAARKRPQFSKR
ncbi:MAG: ribosomal protein S9 [Candidatus Improbicoccus devescovinae]|nr:MAG: ribosomal protein S9 [Candidatus Improbicoccus devescovinae]